MIMGTEYNDFTFRDVADNPDFLHMILQNVSSCVLILDHKMRLQAVNDAYETMFKRFSTEDSHLLRCGEAIGCANTVESMEHCGESLKCVYCELREAALFSYVSKKGSTKKQLSREFYNNKGTKEMRHLQFLTRVFNFKGQWFILVIVDDITDLIIKEKIIEYQQHLLDIGHN